MRLPEATSMWSSTCCEEQEAKVDAIDSNGQALLHQAILKNHRDLVEYICGLSGQMLLNSAFEKKMKIQEVDDDADGDAPGFIASSAHTGSKAGYVHWASVTIWVIPQRPRTRAHSMS